MVSPMTTLRSDASRPSATRPEVMPMTCTRPSSSRLPLASATAVALALAALAACRGGDVAAAAALAKKSAHARTALSAAQGCAEATVHDKHANRFPCTACHPTGATFGFAVPYTFPKGTTTAGGVLVRGTATTPTTCAVGCHHPNGPVREVAWNAPRPLACTACHDTAALPPAHPTVASTATREECERCHLASGHGGGAVALVGHGAAWTIRGEPRGSTPSLPSAG